MKILIIHTYYKIKGGEDIVFEQEVELLSQYYEVETLKFYNKGGLMGLIQFLLSIWNVFSAKKLKQKIKDFDPDLIHIHNLHFASGPLIIRTIKKNNIPIVMTLHNYRLLCPSAILLHNNKIFTDSLRVNFPWKAVKNKVYRNSLIQTFWLAFVYWFHRKINTWEKIDIYIMLSNFTKSLFEGSYFSRLRNKFIIKPNFKTNIKLNNRDKEDFYLYVGRLSEEKGLETLLDTFKNSTYKLKIIGNGPLIYKVKNVCSNFENIEYLGEFTKNEVLDYMNRCSALIFPSICLETFGMTIVEAFTTKTVVISTNLGGPSEMIIDEYNGLFFEVGNSSSLMEKIEEWNRKSFIEKEKMRENAYFTYKEKYTSEKNIVQFDYIYSSLISKNK